MLWNPERPPWVDALAFEAAVDAADLDAALDLYIGPLLPDCYDERAQLEQERLHLRYLAVLEAHAHRHYEARRWEAALDDAETLLSADPLNEAAARLVMACRWALGQREAARRGYEAFRRRLRDKLQKDPLPETTVLHQRILRGEAHPDQAPPPTDETIATQRAHFSLLETLGAFRQGLEQAKTWAAQGKETERLTSIERGLALALDLGDVERILTGYLHQGRTLIAMGQTSKACTVCGCGNCGRLSCACCWRGVG